MRHRGLQAWLWCLCLWCWGCSQDEQVLTLSRWRFEPPSGLASTEIELPANLGHELPDQRSHYWLRTTVTLPAEMRGQELTLAFPFFLGASRLYANGHEASLLDVENDDAYRAVGGQRFHVSREWSSDTLELALRVEHTFTRSAWIETAPRLSATRGGDAWTRFVQIWNQGLAMLAQATISVLFLFYALLFLLDRRQTVFAWAALEALAGSVYPSTYDGVSLWLYGTWEQVILGLGLPLSLWASVHFAHAQLGLARPPRWIDAMFVGVTAITLAGHGLFSVVTIAGPPIIASLSANVLYQMVLTARLWRERRSVHAGALFLSWGTLGLLATPEMISWLGFGQLFGGLQGGCLGIIVIAFLQSAVFGAEHIAYLRRSDELKRELASRIDLLQKQNVEVARLNDELFRQVAARSEQLAQALTRLAAGALAEPIELTEGTLVDGRYRVVRSIGAGGMGRVYEVERTADGTRLALKVLARPEGMAELARFSREAQIAAQVRHPNVVALVDVDVSAAGFLYLVMELVPGMSLREQESRYGEIWWALAVLRQIADGLVAIHACGVVHRDLKPANVLLVGDAPLTEPRAKITDFGVSSVGGDRVVPTQGPESAERPVGDHISSAPRPVTAAEITEVDLTGLDLTRQPIRRGHSSNAPRPGSNPPTETTQDAPALPRDGSSSSRPRSPSSSSAPTPLSSSDIASLSSSSSGLTQTGMLIGTPRYMAPELAAGARFTTPAVDIFSFGVLAYELLARSAPFSEPPVVSRLSQRAFPLLRPLGVLCPLLEPELARMLERCVNEDPEQRPSAVELAQALAEASGDELSEASTS